MANFLTITAIISAQTEPVVSQPHSFLELFLFGILQQEQELKCLR